MARLCLSCTYVHGVLRFSTLFDGVLFASCSQNVLRGAAKKLDVYPENDPHNDIEHYQKIVVALNETIRLMHEIDDLIPGWPLI